MHKDILIDVNNLKQYFRLNRREVVKAVDDVSFKIYRGETFGLVGESGSGKSTIGKTLIGLHKQTDGSIVYKGDETKDIKGKKDKVAFRKSMQMIFQDPYACLNPRMTVEDIIGEGLEASDPNMTLEERRKSIVELLETVGLHRDHISRYPHEFSGGQRQRIGIARALAVEPDFIIADEPISALDVSIQAQVVNLMKKLQRERGLTYLFIAHDLSMVKYISDRIGVMYRGKLVEIASADKIYSNALHPYTRSLLSAIPLPDPDYEKRRKRISYDDSCHDYSLEKPRWIEVDEGHLVYLSESEYKNTIL